MKIKQLFCSPGYTGFYFDDQHAIKAGAEPDGSSYSGEPLTDGFSRVRQPGESVSILLELENGQICWGDCAAVQYSGTDGRDPLFLADTYIPQINRIVKPWIEGREAEDWRVLCRELETLTDEDGKKLHTAIRYGVSQALLDAVAKSHIELMAETVAREFGTELVDKPVPLFGQTGDNRYDNADKLIIKRADVLPHALINNVRTKLGRDGEILLDYARWLTGRVKELRMDESYNPVLHFDVYGTIGEAFGEDNISAMADYLGKLVQACAPHKVNLEGPMDAGSRGRQIELMAALSREIDRRGLPVRIVADEWCNTLEDCRAFAEAGAGHIIQIKTPDLGSLTNTAEAITICKANGIGAYQGGTCNETERSAECCVHIAMAMAPDQMLAKPGMGVDEGFMICTNEMNRILALRDRRRV